jgi:hypothetical protein
MRWPQFSLLTLGGLVAFAAVASAALVYASELWSSTLYTAAFAWLTFAVLAAIYRDGAKRAFWVGSAVCGWIYLILLCWPESARLHNETMDTMEVGSELATTRLARWTYIHVLPKIRERPSRPSSGGGGFGGGGGGGNFFFPQFGGGGAGLSGAPAAPTAAPATRPYPFEATFIRVFHALSTWLLALVGGAIGRWLYITRPAVRGET